MGILAWTGPRVVKGDAGTSVEFWDARLQAGTWPVATIQGPTRYNSRHRVMVTVRWKDSTVRDCASVEEAMRAAEEMVAADLQGLGVIPR